MSGLSFPPLMDHAKWKGANRERVFPGGGHTWKKALAPRPLRERVNAETARDLQASTGAAFNVLQGTIQLPAEVLQETAASAVASVTPSVAPRSKRMPLYDSVWPHTNPPTFSVWDYCQKTGHAMPPNSLPAPRVTDMKSWFATYGHPTEQALLQKSEFTALNKSIPKGDGECSRTVKMYRGRITR